MTQARVAVALLAAAAGVALTVSLGNWQMRRAEQKSALQARWETAGRLPPVQLDRAGEPTPELPARVRLRGRFSHRHSVWLDNRNLDGAAGFWLVTPLLTEGGGAVLINRGWAARDPAERTRLPQVGRPEQVVEIEGLATAHAARVLELGTAAPPRTLPAVWQNLDYAAYESASGLKVARVIVQQTSALDDGLVRRWSRPDTGVDRHRGYAVQWYALAGLIVVLAGVHGARAWWRAARPHETA